MDHKYWIYGGAAATCLFGVVVYKKKKAADAAAAQSASNDAYMTVPSGVSFAPVSSGSGGGNGGNDTLPMPLPPVTNAPQTVDPMIALLTQLLAPPVPAPTPAPAPSANTGLYNRFIPSPVGQVWYSTGGAVGVRSNENAPVMINTTDGHTYTLDEARTYTVAQLQAGNLAGVRTAQAQTGIDDQSLNAILGGTGLTVPVRA